jgi:hypothetical protein
LTFRYRSLKSNDGNGSSTLVDLSKSFAQNVVIPMPKKKKKGSNRAGKTLFGMKQLANYIIMFYRRT